MSRKAAAHGAPQIALVAPIPVEPPSTVSARKRARRAKESAPAPLAVKPTIDLARPDARKALAVAFPKVIAGKTVEATHTEEVAALAYFESRDAEARSKGAKEAAGNVLCYAIGDGEELHGDGWKASWKFQKGDIDWGALCKELAIESDVIERFRKPQSRVIRVTETVEK